MLATPHATSAHIAVNGDRPLLNALQRMLVSNGSSASARQHRLVSRIEELDHQQQASSPPTGKLTTNSCMRHTGPACDTPSCRHPTQREITNSYQNQYTVSIQRKPKKRGAIQYYSITEKHFEKRVFAKKGLGSDFCDEFLY